MMKRLGPIASKTGKFFKHRHTSEVKMESYLKMNTMLSLTAIIGALGVLIGISSLATLIVSQELEAFSAAILLGQSSVPYAFTLILGGAAVLAISIAAATLRGVEL